MERLAAEMRETARRLLTKGGVTAVLGWEKEKRADRTPPVTVTRPEETDRLAYDMFAVNSAALHLLDWREREGKVAVFVKGCDSRGLVRLIHDNQFPRERLVVIGLPCAGKVGGLAGKKEMPAAGPPLLTKCLECTHPNPVLADIALGEVTVTREAGKPTGLAAEEPTAVWVGSKSAERFAPLAALEAMRPDERRTFWRDHEARCVRCYACRSVCPACSCPECAFDTDRAGWTGRYASPATNAFYLTARAMHIAGRCTECGECERVCPSGLPLMLLNRHLIRETGERFSAPPAGLDPADRPPLGDFRLDEGDGGAP